MINIKQLSCFAIWRNNWLFCKTLRNNLPTNLRNNCRPACLLQFNGHFPTDALSLAMEIQSCLASVCPSDVWPTCVFPDLPGEIYHLICRAANFGLFFVTPWIVFQLLLSPWIVFRRLDFDLYRYPSSICDVCKQGLNHIILVEDAGEARIHLITQCR